MFNVQRRKRSLGMENWTSVWKAIVSVPVLEKGGKVWREEEEGKCKAEWQGI